MARVMYLRLALLRLKLHDFVRYTIIILYQYRAISTVKYYINIEEVVYSNYTVFGVRRKHIAWLIGFYIQK